MYDQDPAGHHQTSMLLHALNAVLLFWVLWRATGYAGRSFVVAAIFAVHPINVESVVWISERKTVLSMMFFLLALGAYRWYVSKPQVGRYAVVAVLFALGLMAKPQIITFPFVLLLWDYWPLRRMAIGKESGSDSSFSPKSFRALLEEKLPLFGIAAASAVMTMKAQRAGGAVLSLASSPLSVRFSNAIVSLREVHREGALADAPRAYVSSSRRFAASLAGLRRAADFAGHNYVGRGTEVAPVSVWSAGYGFSVRWSR